MLCYTVDMSTTREIHLTQGYVTVVDEADFDYLSQWNWSVTVNGYAQRSYKNLTTGKKGIMYLHRQIMMPPDGMDVDHINRNRLDNRRSNLRICNRAINLLNKGPEPSNTSGYRGVYLDKRNGRWRVRMKWQGRYKTFGGYDTALEASNVYEAKRQEILASIK